MCLVVNFNSRTEYYKNKPSEGARRAMKIANKDIKVIKILRRRKGIYYTPFQNFVIVLNHIYSAKFKYSSLNVNENFGSTDKNDLFINDLHIEDGLHSCANLDRARRYKRWYCLGQYYDAIIPKGSKYFEQDGLICSNQLKIIGLHKIKLKKKK